MMLMMMMMMTMMMMMMMMMIMMMMLARKKGRQSRVKDPSKPEAPVTHSHSHQSSYFVIIVFIITNATIKKSITLVVPYIQVLRQWSYSDSSPQCRRHCHILSSLSSSSSLCHHQPSICCFIGTNQTVFLVLVFTMSILIFFNDNVPLILLFDQNLADVTINSWE